MTAWRVPIVLTIERNCATAAGAAEAAELAMDCLPDGYGMTFVIGVPAQVTGPGRPIPDPPPVDMTSSAARRDTPA